MSANKATIQASAYRFAAKLASIEDFGKQVELNISAKEQVENGPVQFLFNLKRWLGDDFANLPQPGSKTGNNPDKYEDYIPDGKGGQRKVEGSFYNDLAERHPIGQNVQAVLDDLTKAAKKDPTASEEALLLDDAERQSARAKWEGKRNVFRALLKKAVGIQYQLDQFNSLVGVTAKIITDGDGNPTDSRKPILIRATEGSGADEGKAETLGVSQFLGYDPVAAALDGGTWAAVRKTAGRQSAAGQGGTDKSGMVAKITKPEKALEYMIELSAFLKTDAGMAAWLAYAAKNLDECIVPAGDLSHALDGFCGKHGRRYVTLTEAAEAKVA